MLVRANSCRVVDQLMQASRSIISAVQVIPTLAPDARPGEARQWQLSIGLTLDHFGTYWGDALVQDVNWSAVALQQFLTSLLVGRPFIDPLSLIADIESWLDEPQHPHPPLPPAVGYGLSLAIMRAEAQRQNRALAATLNDAYQLSPAVGIDDSPTRLLAEVHDFAATAALFDEMIADQPAALGYRYTGGQLLEAMGERGAILQRFGHELQQRVTTLGVEGYRPDFYFALRGGYGQLAAAAHGEVKSGPVLGYLWGLEQATQPFSVLVEDPVVLDTLNEQIAFLTQLRRFIEMRKMGLQLVSRAYTDSLEGTTSLAKARAAHFIWLDGMQLGSLSRLMAAVRICREAGVGVIVGGDVSESVAAATAACHLALACRPDYLLVRPGQGTGIGYALMNRELSIARASLS